LDQALTDPFIATDRGVYEAELDSITIPGGPLPWDTTVVMPADTAWYLHFTIGMTYTNRSDRPVYLATCGGPHPPRLERLVDGDWVAAYEPPHLLCIGPYIEIASEAAYAWDFRINGYEPRSRVRPSWLLRDVDGTYRVNWWSTVRMAPDVGADPVPLPQRISNAFRVTGSLP
jgi:hypothetical protein